MAEKSIKQKAIEHYDRIIEYAENSIEKDADEMCNRMFWEIHESIGAQFCSYCKKHSFSLILNEACHNCELNVKSCPFFGCCNGLYSKMSESETTEDFIRYAKLVRQYIIDHG